MARIYRSFLYLFYGLDVTCGAGAEAVGEELEGDGRVKAGRQHQVHTQVIINLQQQGNLRDQLDTKPTIPLTPPTFDNSTIIYIYCVNSNIEMRKLKNISILFS